jgi:hypothetical protein
MMNDVLDGLEQLRAAFIRANLNPPSVILLDSQQEGMRFVSAIGRDLALIEFVGPHNEGPWIECTVGGFVVRWLRDTRLAPMRSA